MIKPWCVRTKAQIHILGFNGRSKGVCRTHSLVESDISATFPLQSVIKYKMMREQKLEPQHRDSSSLKWETYFAGRRHASLNDDVMWWYQNSTQSFWNQLFYELRVWLESSDFNTKWRDIKAAASEMQKYVFLPLLRHI